MGTEAAQTEVSSSTSASAVSSFLANPLLESPAAASAKEAPFVTPRFQFSTQPVAAFSANKRRSGAGNKTAQESIMPPSNNGSSAAQFSSPTQGVSNCYVFKSRLQEYAQKKGLATPVYETIKEGPSHEPSFRSTVIVKDVRYDSLPGFFNRKAAEQSAAEVALTELAKSDEVECISQPVHETGLCKNLLQEYAQKMNYAIPLYQCQKVDTPGRASCFKCTVEIGGIQYIGGSAKTKREAEIKAARTALLAIQSSASESSHTGNSQLTVIPFRKRGAETAPGRDKAVPKAKKARFKKKMSKNKLSKLKANNNNNQSKQRPGKFDVIVNQQSRSESDESNASVVQATGNGLLPVPAVESLQDRRLVSEICGKLDVIADQQSRSESDQTHAYVVQTGNGLLTVPAVESWQDGRLVPEMWGKETTNNVVSTANQNAAKDSENTADSNQSIAGLLTRISPESNEDAATMVSGVTQTEAGPSTVITGLTSLAESIQAGGGQA